MEFAHSGNFLVARTQNGQLAVLSVPDMRVVFHLHTRSRADDVRLHRDDREIDVLDAESGVIHTYPVTRAGLVEALTPFNPGWPFSTGSAPPQMLAVWEGEITRQAAAIGYLNDFRVMALCTVITIPLLLVMQRQAMLPRPSRR